MTESADCHKRFQAAVDVIHSLPKNGAYRPSYEIMLRFYGLYKQAVCGPCKCSRPGFWDPVGRYKWDAWSRLGDMSCEAAMRAYVEEMKKVAQEVIDTMPVNEKTASLFHYFEPLYVVIHDMPQPPEALLRLRAEVEGTAQTVCPEEADPDSSGEELPKRLHVYPKKSSEIQEVERTAQTVCPEEADPDSGEESMGLEVYPRESIEIQGPAPEGLVVTSDSESDVFCDSLEQLDQNKGVPWSDALHSESMESSKEPGNRCCPTSYAMQVGAGQGGEGSQDSSGPPLRGRGLGRETRHGWREERRGRSPGRLQRANRGVSGAGGRDSWEDGTNVSQNAHMQRQIVLALQRLREDMHSVMERLEAVERLAAAQTQSSEWRSLAQFRVPAPEEAWWWPFGVSGRTALLLLLWPLVVHGLMFLLRRRHRKFYLPT